MRIALLLATLWSIVCSAGLAWGQAPGGKPDLAKAGQIVNSVCAACHGADGNSPTAANPNLAGQQAEYLTLQLSHFKSGVRSNPVMAGMAAGLSPEDMRALGVYFSQQLPKAGAAHDPALVAAGQKLYRGGNTATGVPACAGCHTPTGVGIPSRYPRLSGQYADYAYAQLKAFKTGERGMDKEGKDLNGRIMAQVAGRMSDQEMRAVAEYAAGLH
ncbi:MAG TPA: c-type cytochrome [Casimicrobiaceae bacterium]